MTRARRDRGRPDVAKLVEAGGGKVPPSALVLSLCALAVPLFASVLAPEGLEDQYDVLIWLPALVPAFLLTYYRGWSGASLALAAGMVTLTLSQVILLLIGVEPPAWPYLLILVSVWVFTSLGVGWFGELLHKALREAEARALRDALTGLPNRGHAGLFLDTAFGAAERGGQVTVVLFDLDSFKVVNDVHGHAAGDETLVAFADVLRSYTRRSDMSARFGGEEFVSVLTGSGGTAGARVFAERVQKSLRSLPLPWGPVTVSVGIAGYTPETTSPDLVLAEADRALYAAKREGRNRVVIAGPESEAPPLAEPATTGRDSRPPVEAGGDGPRNDRPPRRGAVVLVVDDDEIMLEGVSRILRRAGFRTVTARDGVDALGHVLGSEPPELILSDVVMPRMGGLTLADRVGESRPEVRVLLMSGYGHDQVLPGLPPRVVALIRKPLTPGGLVEAVRSALQVPPAVVAPHPSERSGTGPVDLRPTAGGPRGG